MPVKDLLKIAQYWMAFWI